MSYAWGGTVDAAFTDLMREGIRDDPALVGRLRAMFIKVRYRSCAFVLVSCAVILQHTRYKFLQSHFF